MTPVTPAGSSAKPILTVGPDQVLHRGQFLTLMQRPFLDSRSSRCGHWEYVERKNKGRVVTVVGITEQDELILTKTLRLPFGREGEPVLEFCAGLPDREGECEVDLARRELLEETGYVCKNICPLVSGVISAGLTSDEMAIYVGTGATKVQAPKLEPAEVIEVVLVPKTKFRALLSDPPDGLKVDLKLWALLPLLCE
ncbi:MAG: NUDIX hydrolase [Patescibacteria group bacterium]